MAKKPKHDPTTAWTMSNNQGFSSAYQNNTLYNSMLNVYKSLAYGYPQPFTPQQGALPVSAIAPTVIPALGPSQRIDWATMRVGETCDAQVIVFEIANVQTTYQLADNTYHLRGADGSEGVYMPTASGGTVTKTKMADPVLTPAEVEETTELLIGWRTYNIENYKLRGAWSTWESRVFHASCNCKEFASTATNRALQFEAVEGRREQMREHLASGKGTCGVYSRKKLSAKSDYEIYPSSYPIRVAARCVNYGLGYEYDGGYRSEFCRIEHLYLLSKVPLAVNIATGSMVESVMLPVGYAAQTVTPETVAQVLSTTYGVPCDVMSPLEFAYKDEEGML